MRLRRHAGGVGRDGKVTDSVRLPRHWRSTGPLQNHYWETSVPTMGSSSSKKVAVEERAVVGNSSEKDTDYGSIKEATGSDQTDGKNGEPKEAIEPMPESETSKAEEKTPRKPTKSVSREALVETKRELSSHHSCSDRGSKRLDFDD